LLLVSPCDKDTSYKCKVYVPAENKQEILGDTNNVLPQSLTSRAGSFLTFTRHMLAYTVWTLRGLLAERTPTMKSTKKSSQSQISY